MQLNNAYELLNGPKVVVQLAALLFHGQVGVSPHYFTKKSSVDFKCGIFAFGIGCR